MEFIGNISVERFCYQPVDIGALCKPNSVSALMKSLWWRLQLFVDNVRPYWYIKLSKDSFLLQNKDIIID